MMHNYNRLLVVGMISSILYTTQVIAYSYMLHNQTDHEIWVDIEVGVGSWKRSDYIPAGTSTTVVFDGSWSGLCISRVTVRSLERYGGLDVAGCGNMTFTITQTAKGYKINKE